jgi:hypothetical protein
MVNWPGVYGIRIIESAAMATRTQVRFPKSKTRRIRKKWAKREENWRLIPWTDVYRLSDGTLIAHPVTARRWRAQMQAMEG